ncbi:MAG: ribonuclease R [Planctomycetaceae bacterium]
MADLSQQLIDFVTNSGYKPVKPKTLAKNMGIVKKQSETFREALDQLLANGTLKLSENGRVQPPGAKGTLRGIVHKIQSGSAFIILHEPKPKNLKEDVYVESRDLKDAQNGDEVIIKLQNSRGGRRSGVVVEVLERATNVFVGTYFEDDGVGWVEIDGKDFNEPIWVGDPGAKGAQPEDKVVIEMLRFPTARHAGEAVLTKVLGPHGEIGVDTQLVIHEFGLPEEFPEDVLTEARIAAENFSDDVPASREDLTGELIVTIDPADARDFDDAISLSRAENGHWRLGVHIADVASFVTPGSALDREAVKRGTSVYLPGMVIPMLPEVLSNGLASLQENKLRYTKSAFIEFNPEGIPVHTRFANTAIRVTKRFAYEQVLPLVHDAPDALPNVATEVRTLLKQMHTLAMLLRARRYQKGYLELDMPEIKLDFDKDHRVIGAHETMHDESHQMIEEFMLAANIAVARELNDRKIEFLRRTHGEPSDIKLTQFQEFVSGLGYQVDNPRSRRGLQELLKEVKGRPENHAVSFALLRSMKQAEYSPIPMGHFALAEENYCHFTSPIRRYPDLTIHRLIDSIVTRNKASRGPTGDALIQLGVNCSKTERRAERAERELTKLKLLNFFEDRIGTELEATITGVDRYGFFVRGDQLPVEGLVHISTLTEMDAFQFERGMHALIGRHTGVEFRLGDRVLVKVARVDVPRRELDFRLVKLLGSRQDHNSLIRDQPSTSAKRKGWEKSPRTVSASSSRGGKSTRRNSVNEGDAEASPRDSRSGRGTGSSKQGSSQQGETGGSRSKKSRSSKIPSDSSPNRRSTSKSTGSKPKANKKKRRK